jgi:hypothetical protein
MKVAMAAVAALCIAGCSAVFVDSAGPDPYGLSWRLDPASPVTPDAQVVHVLANEGNCSDGSADTTKERLLAPAIEYRADEIAIGLFVTRHADALLSCPDVPLEIELNQPVGNRRVLPLSERN